MEFHGIGKQALGHGVPLSKAFFQTNPIAIFKPSFSHQGSRDTSPIEALCFDGNAVPRSIAKGELLVGVLLDILRQTETHLLQRHYDGFLRKGKIKGRYDRQQGSSGKTASSTTLVYLWAFAAVLVLVGIVAWMSR